MRVYLDGLDEVQDLQFRKRILDLAREELNRSDRVQLIVTSRDNVGGPWLNWLKRLSLQGMQPEQFRDLARQWFAGSDCPVEEFMSDVARLPDLSAVMRTPLLATLTILIYRQTRQLPESRPRLYQLFVDLLSGGWDLAKGVIRRSQFMRDAKVKVLSCLAYTVHRAGLRVFRSDEVTSAIRAEFPKLPDNKAALLADELLRDCVIESKGTEVQFRHLSFQEFLAARFCVTRPRDTQIRHAVKVFSQGDDWWREVIRFYVMLVGSPMDFRRWLNSFGGTARIREILEFFDEAEREMVMIPDASIVDSNA